MHGTGTWQWLHSCSVCQPSCMQPGTILYNTFTKKGVDNVLPFMTGVLLDVRCPLVRLVFPMSVSCLSSSVLNFLFISFYSSIFIWWRRTINEKIQSEYAYKKTRKVQLLGKFNCMCRQNKTTKDCFHFPLSMFCFTVLYLQKFFKWILLRYVHIR